MNKLPWQLHIAISVILVFLQTTLFRHIEIKGVSPDLVLIFVVFSANSRGAFQGQIISFSAGLVEDILSLSPLGFNSLIKTILGYFSGKLRGKIMFDPLIMPVLFIIVATLLKEVLSFLVSVLFLNSLTGYFSFSILIQTGLNVILAPVIYNIFLKLRIFGENERESF